jgi:hypothetical protein
MSQTVVEAEYEFDVAVSFAGEDREYVEGVVSPLKAAGVRVFYDADYAAETWGEDLVEYFDGIYRQRSRFTVIFISQHYAAKMWPRHERRSALARALVEPTPYVLPVRLDDTALDGLRPTVAYLDARQTGVDGIVNALRRKLSGQTPAQAATISHVPRTEVERQEVLLGRPAGWEYLYFAAELLRGRDALEGKYRDHEVGYAAPTGEFVSRENIFQYVNQAVDDVGRVTDTMGRLFDSAVQERALGAPGVSGDPDRISHLAMRINSCYEELIDWAARLRGVSTPSEFHGVLDLLARYVDDPITAYRTYIDGYVEAMDGVPATLATGGTLVFENVLELRISPEVTRAYHAEMDRLKRVEFLN